MTNRIIGLTCIKDERNRYLERFLEWNLPQLDVLFVLDDLSKDGGGALAKDAGAIVCRRPSDAPAFAYNEGLFRQIAWLKMEEHMTPSSDDWIICLDADEFLIGDLRSELETTKASTLRFKVHECFDRDEEGLLTRTDGFWDSIWAIRAARAQGMSGYAPTRLGGGSLPHALTESWATSDDVSILHLGYLSESDRREKYERYRSASGNAHSPRHVESILTRPSLKRWTGANPLEMH